MDIKQKRYFGMFALGFVVWILGTWHGGWQDQAQSAFEMITDIMGWTLMIWGIAGDILNNLTIVKHHNLNMPEHIVKEAVEKIYRDRVL